MYDEASLGEVEDHQELYEYLESYDREHYIGSENEPGWNEHILKQTPHLFSLGRDLEKVSACNILILYNYILQCAIHTVQYIAHLHMKFTGVS